MGKLDKIGKGDNTGGGNAAKKADDEIPYHFDPIRKKSAPPKRDSSAKVEPTPIDVWVAFVPHNAKKATDAKRIIYEPGKSPPAGTLWSYKLTIMDTDGDGIPSNRDENAELDEKIEALPAFNKLDENKDPNPTVFFYRGDENGDGILDESELAQTDHETVESLAEKGPSAEMVMARNGFAPPLVAEGLQSRNINLDRVLEDEESLEKLIDWIFQLLAAGSIEVLGQLMTLLATKKVLGSSKFAVKMAEVVRGRDDKLQDMEKGLQALFDRDEIDGHTRAQIEKLQADIKRHSAMDEPAKAQVKQSISDATDSKDEAANVVTAVERLQRAGGWT
jgi:hypothetical protein